MTKEQEIIIKDLLNNFKTLDTAADTDATYILSNGTVMDTHGEQDPHSQHINVAKYIERTFKVKDCSENDDSLFMAEVNAIRVTPWINGIVLPPKRISVQQENALLDLFTKLKVSPEFPLTITSYDGGDTLLCERLHMLAQYDILDEIRYYYKRGKFSRYIVEKANAKPDFIKLNESIFFQHTLLEDTRMMLINKSKGRGDYKNQSHGKNRFERKKYSKIANTVKAYNEIDMNKLYKDDLLEVKLPVVGETDSYHVTIQLEGVIENLAKNIKNNHNILDYKAVVQAVTKAFNTGNVYVKCSCPDYKFTYAHWNITNKVSVDDTAQDPGPGKGIRNPRDEKGRGCKHVLLVLSNGDWLMKVASVINNYIHYAEEKLQKPFYKLIFPKLYGIQAEEMVEKDLIDDEKFLDSSKGLIDAINEYGKNRGKYPRGSNKNPAAEKEKLKQKQLLPKNKELNDASK